MAQSKSKDGAKPKPKSEAQKAKILSGVVPYLSVQGASDAAAFYVKAFGAVEAFRYPVDDKGRTMHIHLHINGGSVMLADFYPEHGHAFEAPQAFSMHMTVADVDAAWKRATDAGAEIVLPLQEMFWGDRYGQLRDPFGVIWSLAAPA